MTIRKIALGACLCLCGIALAQVTTYTVKQGDTLSEIAGKFGADKKAIVYANNLQNAHKLKLGQKLVIPSAEAVERKTSQELVGPTYTVVAGDNDEAIADKLGITPHDLRASNPGVKWTRLQIGQTLAVPGKKDWFEALTSQAVAHAQSQKPTSVPAVGNQPKLQVASSVKAQRPKPKVVPRTYTVRKGDNDWIIAKRLSMKPSELRTLNPNVKWGKLQIGTVLRLPGTKTIASAGTVASKGPNLPALKSRYAVLTGIGVQARRGPSVRFPVVVQVDKGTRVMVLDRETSWYKVRFPKGTEAWVRRDFLAPTAAPKYAAKKPVAKKPTVVAKKPSKASSKTKLVASKAAKSSQATRNRRSSGGGQPLAYASNGNGGLLDRAQSFLGVRYRYGAASRSATDCSGFTTQVFKSQGVKLPRTAAQQSTRGQKVSKGELKAGDLVFFNTRGSRVSHVGIYKGNGKFIHASSGKGRVMESSLNEGYYQRRFAGARRVISSKKPVAKPSPKPKVEEKSEPVVPVDKLPDMNQTSPPPPGN